MTRNTTRARQMVDALPWHGCKPMCGACRVALDTALAAHLDAAERRGEKRVMRYYGLPRREYEESLDRARKARRARQTRAS